MKLLKRILIVLLSILVLLLLIVYFTTFHPSELQEASVNCESNAPILDGGKQIKLLSWNVQYFAGKNRVFWYDVPDESGPDTAPSREEVENTLKKVANVILEQNPDFVLFQEVDDGAKKTYSEDQSERILPLLSDLYPCRTEAFYWKAGFVPHPKILGSVGMKLTIFSKYKIVSALRHQLPTPPADPITQQLQLKRAVLQADIATHDGKTVTLLNTHLDAFSMGTDTMHRQVRFIENLLETLDAKKMPWILAGDFNLLPPGFSRGQLHPNGAFFYSDEEEISPIFQKWNSTVSLEELNGPNKEKFFTHVPNDPQIAKPDRTIDYIFYSKGLAKKEYKVLQEGEAADASDHLPLEATFSQEE
ncbi:endonuclease/exonuclease/phosphatase family protein [Leptospira semungkisensis]|uniref:Endonuclease/exonuclease/phosphatase family protein n=1 Tax=Leptospira semungkisensis TaxID=2484985 RepID=A0A4R9G0T6_9LEPT|nr:endonuclease/exonuclease/phosphatase family protein [Leptospira semungkisensis]TGK05006.1 endonuclease/exonuclease/phosphatase family protein [Leptospira semungkisensis]